MKRPRTPDYLWLPTDRKIGTLARDDGEPVAEDPAKAIAAAKRDGVNLTFRLSAEEIAAYVGPETRARLALEAAGKLRRDGPLRRRGRGRPPNRMEPSTMLRNLETLTIREKARALVTKAAAKVAAARRRIPARYQKALDQLEEAAFAQGWEAALAKHAALITLARGVAHKTPGLPKKPE